MVSQETIEIILRAIDNASGPTRQVDDAMRKVGDTAQQANQKTANASRLTQQQMTNLSHEIKGVIASTDQVGSKGARQFNRYDSAIQSSIVTFNRLDSETQDMLRYLSQMSDKGREAFIGMSSKAQEAISKFNEMQNATTGWGNTLDITKTKMQMMGTNTDSLKGKIQVVGNAIQTHLGNKWDSLKSKVTSFANTIKTGIGNALTSIRSKLDSLGSAFSGLGGIISTAIGGLGMASITQMTVGLAMNRERMTALTSATMGSAEAGQHFVDVMDDLTNRSLVSLDDLGQAMSTIKMSTGMTNQELENFTTTVNDIGQRAILMGKSGDEAMALMQAAGRGLNGEFEMLKANFGITKEQLMDLGWSGAADDVKGYQEALDAALEKGGSMNGMMDTSVGHLETLKKNFRVAGRHVGEMFTPYIDQAVQMLNGLNETCPGLFENLVMVAGAISGFATIAPSITPALTAFDMLTGKTKTVLQFLGLMEAEEGALTASILYNSIVTKVSTAAHAVWGTVVGILTGEITLASAATAVWNAILSMNPIMLVVIAALALVAAIYEIGKAFGWWSNVQGMLAAIWDGINRLWQAFINHPDVQAAISAITWALSALWNGIVQAGQAILKFFNISTGGNFDVVRALIEGIGVAWQIITFPIRTVISLIQSLYGAFSSFYSGALVPFGSYISDILAPVFSWLSELWTALIGQIQPVIDVFNQFQAGQVSLVEVITTVGSTLWNLWVTLATSLSNLILQLVGNLLTWAIQGGLNVLNGIGLYLSQVPGRVWNWLGNTAAARILLALVKWVTYARQKAQQFLTSVITYFSQLPGRVYTQLIAVASRIISVGQQWVSNAKSKAQEIVNGVANILSNTANAVASALSGVVDAIVKPFRDAYNKAKEYWDMITNLGNAQGGDSAWGGDDFTEGGGLSLLSPQKVIIDDSRIEIDHNHNLKIDLENVPAHIDTDTLIKMLTSKEVLEGFVASTEYQTVDKMAKDRLKGRFNRAIGG